MTLRTPRRRISPRTKLRYRAIREFFRRAVGSASQQDISINSSINVNVTDLQRKIVGLEEQLDQVSKHCRDIVCLDNCSRRTSESLLQLEPEHTIGTINELTEASSDKKSNGIDTQLIYKSPDNTYKKLEDTEYTIKPSNTNSVSDNQITVSEYSRQDAKVKSKKNKLHKISNNDPSFNKHKTRSVIDNIATPYSTCSFHSLENTRSLYPANTDHHSHIHNRYQSKEHYMQEMISQYHKEKKYKENIKKHVGDHFKNCYEERPVKVHKSRRLTQELDKDFIADIIRRQYKPVKLFGAKESDFSQISAPVCRDQDFSTQDNILEDPELYSCAYGVPHKQSQYRHQDLNRMRSICDTRLYSSKKRIRQKRRKMYPETYCDSEMYDLIPVKERSSPKTRRKFIEDSATSYDQCREVPPSPRTQRPKLNLKAQYYIPEQDYVSRNQFRRRSPNRQKCYQDCIEQFESDLNSDVVLEKNMIKPRKLHKPMKVVVEEKQMHDQSQDVATKSSLQYPQYVNEHTSMTIDSSLNKTQEIEIDADKTDKALCEIKDILQSFLHEIKKETIASQCDKSDFTPKIQDDGNGLQDTSKLNGNVMPNSASFNNFNGGQCGMTPYVGPFNNPCCYPLVPLCPLNCPVTMPGSYVIPSQSFTCTNCGNIAKESHSTHCCNKNSDPTCQTETETLIKEIYKYVAQSTANKQDCDSTDRKSEETENTKNLTSRSVGGSYGNFHHDAKVGTQPLKCYSKSCEAIGSRMVVDPNYNQTNPSFSDTLLEKLSLEVTQSTTDCDMDVTNLSYPYKAKRNRLSKVFRTFGIFKKRKKDVIEELSESESVVDTDMNITRPPPFRQEITNYMMYGHDYHCPEHVESLYPKPQEFQPDENNYQSGSGYQSCQHDYQGRPYEYKSRPQEFLSQPRDYQLPHRCQSPVHEYPTRPEEYQRPHEYYSEYQPPYNTRGYSQPDPYTQRPQPIRQMSPNPQAPRQPTAPPLNSSYDSTFSGVQPPLCLKEIEVKSTGTQSERKVSLFKKFKKKIRQPVTETPVATTNQYQRNFSTQTQQKSTKPMKPLFNWKTLQSKAMQGMTNDAVEFSKKTQKELAEGDLKIKKAMLKKLFHKRNPFSSRNLIMKTLLGKDKASFGAAPPNLVFKPRMFL